MPVWAAPISSKLASAHSAFKIQNLILPSGRQTACLHMSAPADEDVRILPKAVGNDRNIAAKPTQKAGEAAAHVQAALSGSAKGRCG